MKELEGKIAIVTGAGQGSGQGIAFALSAAGVSVVVAGRTEDKLVQTAETTSSRGCQATALLWNLFITPP